MKSLFDTPLKYKLSFAFILAGALFFRTVNIDEYFFFSDYDEYFTVKTVVGIHEGKMEPGQCLVPDSLASHDAGRLLHDSMRDFGNNTLYNFILGTYIHAVGFSDLNLRLFSVFFGILAILLIHPIGRALRAKNEHILLAAALLAFNPVLIHYSDIIRAYSWCVFLALLYFLFHLKVLSNPGRRLHWIVIGFLGLAMFLSHYLMVYVMGTTFLFFVYQHRKNILQQRSLLLTYGLMGCCAVLFIVTNPQFIESVSSKNASLQRQAELNDTAQKTRKIDVITLRSFADGAVSYLNQYYCYSYFPLGISQRLLGKPGLWIAGALLLILPGILLYSLARSRPPKPILLALWMVVAANIMVFVLVLLSKHDTSFSIKYTIFSIPLYLIAVAFSHGGTRLYTYALTCTALISFSSCINAVFNHYQKAVAVEVAGEKHEILPIHRRELLAITPQPAAFESNCAIVHSEQEVIFLALLNPDWMKVNMCISGGNRAEAPCDTVGVKFSLLH